MARKIKVPITEVENIKRLYWEEQKSRSEISVIYGVSEASIRRFFLRHNIQARTLNEANKIQTNKPEMQAKRRLKLYGKPSGASGKKWKLSHRKFCPHLIGVKNHQWKGGVTNLTIRIRELPEYKAWRLAVFKRDGYQCVQCGNKCCKNNKVIIQGDHIEPLSKILLDYKIITIEEALACVKLWDVDNGRTLCKACHKRTSTYGLNQKYHNNELAKKKL